MNLRKERRQNGAIKIEIFSKPDCHLCDIAKEVVRKVSKSYNVPFEEIDITSDPNLFARFCEQIPVIFINGKKAFKYRVDEEQLRKKLSRLL